MKKIILFSILLLFIASCSNDSDETTKDTLVAVTIQAETTLDNSASSRATWAVPTTNQSTGTTTIAVSFDSNDVMAVSEYGYSGKQRFTNSDNGYNYQSGNFTGTWHGGEKTEWAAVIPYDNNSISMTKNENGEPVNTYTLTVPTTQTTFSTTFTSGVGPSKVTQYSVSPDRNANIMIASKTSEKTHSCFLAPLCAYLYFATSTKFSQVDVISDADICGIMTLTTTGQWDRWENFVTCVNQSSAKIEASTTGGSTKTITATGANVKRDGTYYNEYVVCIYPGTHTITIKTTDGTRTFGSISNLKTSAVNLYYLGVIDDD